MSKITFLPTEEQSLLRESAQRWFADKASEARVRELMATETGFDEAEWAEAAQMGWAGLAIPEELGGAGYGWAETAVIVQEAGATLWCAPMLSSAVLATAALVEAGGEVAADLLPQMAMGEHRATLAHRLDANDVTLDGGSLSGSVSYVVDGASAHTLLVPVLVDGVVTALVAVAAADASAVALPVLDLTRKQAEVTFDGAPVRVVAEGDAAAAAVERATVVGAVVLSVEQVGGATHVLSESVAYGRTRMQFGRAIGSYQAVKHRMADMLTEIEAARSAALHAVRVLDDREPEGAQELAVAAPVAVSWAGETYERAAHKHIQNLGGIGFTWEHPAHLFFKRARASKLMFGGGRAWRDRLGEVLDL